MAITPKTNGVIIIMMRSGSTMLAACLDSHFQIYCPRHEPLHEGHMERLGITSEWNRANEIYNIHGYRSAVFKGTLNQVNTLGESFWAKHKPRVITLTRPNIIRAFVSLEIPQHARGSWHDLDKKHEFNPFLIDPDYMMAQLEIWDRWLTHIPQWPYRYKLENILHLTYDDIQAGSTYDNGITYLSWELSERLCDFFDVKLDGQRLKTEYQRLNPTPLDQLLVNWPELEKRLMNSQFANLLEKYGTVDG